MREGSDQIPAPPSPFELYLRTGLRLVPRVTCDGVELKFNPWHDPANGRFTFSGSGQYFGGGGSFGGGGATGHGVWPKPKTKARAQPASAPKRPTFKGGGGGSGGGGGATSHSVWPAPKTGSRKAVTSSVSRTRSSNVSVTRPSGTRPDWHGVSSHGYLFRIDSAERTRVAEGTLTLNPEQTRSRTAQAKAGGADRRPTDEGGHYIARRFNGPTDVFNHFAQDANFNKGAYQALENKWARATAQGDKVRFRIVPIYAGNSLRPISIEVFYSIGGKDFQLTFPNEPGAR